MNWVGAQLRRRPLGCRFEEAVRPISRVLGGAKMLFRSFFRRFSWTSERPTDEFDELAWLNPPTQADDAAAWDRYWGNRLAHGLGPPMSDMFCDDRALVGAMREASMSTVLCAGNGSSMEPRALAAAGFEVVALDISARGLEIARTFQPSTELLVRFIDLAMLRPGGSVEFVVGDVFDPDVCPGPFDVVIERCTAQNYEASECYRFMDALASRLAEKGILGSQSHDAGWKPGRKPYHATRPWFEQHGWPVWSGDPDAKPRSRVAWPIQTTG